MKQDTIRMFFYGTFRRRFWNHEQFNLGQLDQVGCGTTVRPFTMNVIYGGIPLVCECGGQPGPATLIRGEVYDVPLKTASEICSMMSTSGFQPKAEVVELENGRTEAVIFIFKEHVVPDPLVVEHGDYERYIVERSEAFGIPQTAISEVIT